MAWTLRALPQPPYPYGLWNHQGRWLTGDDDSSGKLVLTSDWATFTTYDYGTAHAFTGNPVGAANNGSGWVVLFGSNGLLRSTDGSVGATWSYAAAPVFTTSPGFVGSSIVAGTGGRFIAAATDFGSGVISTSDDGGVTWVERTTVASAGLLVVSGDTLIHDSGGAIKISTDNGTTWTAATGYPTFTAGSPSSYAAVGTTLLAAAFDRYGGATDVPKISTDGGATWVSINTLTPDHTFSASDSHYVMTDPGGRVFLIEETPTGRGVWYSDNLVAWTSIDMTSAPTSASSGYYLGPITPLTISDGAIALGRFEYMAMSQWGIWTSPAPTLAAAGPTAVTVEDTVLASDEFEPHGGKDLDDAATATDEYTPINARVVDDTATATEDYTPTATFTLTVDEAATVDDDPLIITTGTVNEAATAADLFPFAVAPTVDDAVTATDELTASAVAAQIVDDVVTAQDDVAPGYPAIVDEVAGAVDAFTAAASLVVDDTGTAGDVLTLGGATDEIVDEVAASADEYTNAVTTSALVDEVMAASDAYPFVRNDLIAWVMNTETGAPSWYANWAFTDMVQVGSRVIAIGPGGVAVLGGNTDDGARIPARLKYGYTEFGRYDNDGNPMPDDSRKRVDGVYVGYKSSGVLNLTCKVHGYSEYRYTMPKREAASQPRDNRIQPGKGLVGRYWQLGVENTAGAAFEVTSIAADVATSTRRI